MIPSSHPLPQIGPHLPVCCFRLCGYQEDFFLAPYFPAPSVLPSFGMPGRWETSLPIICTQGCPPGNGAPSKMFPFLFTIDPEACVLGVGGDGPLVLIYFLQLKLLEIYALLQT